MTEAEVRRIAKEEADKATGGCVGVFMAMLMYAGGIALILLFSQGYPWIRNLQKRVAVLEQQVQRLEGRR